jgi:dihydrofolate synthase/folylpolyglutamate synthase
MEYAEALDFLFNALPMYQRIGAAAYKKDLTNTIALCNYLNHPQQHFRSIHIAGTNGKGSTSHMLASILQEHGLKVGLYTSPHLKDFRERIKINGEDISKEFVTKFVEQHHAFFSSHELSFFEMTVGLAFQYFKDEKVDIAIIETGMGGRLDSTNIITPIMSVITNIGWDHMAFLGDTLPAIAGEKAGIIKSKIPVVISERQEEVQDVFMHKADYLDAPCVFADDLYELQHHEYIEENGQLYLKMKFLHWVTDEKISVITDLPGIYQLKNVTGVLAVVDELEEHELLTIDREKVLLGLKKVQTNTGLRGRWQILGKNPLIIADTAHNEPGIREILHHIETLKFEQLHLVIGFVNDKSIDKLLSMLPVTAKYYFTQASIPRAMAADELKEKAATYQLLGDSYPTVHEALEEARKLAGSNDLIFVGGSTFVVADIL